MSEPVLVFTDQSAINAAQLKFYTAKQLLQNAVDAYNAIELTGEDELPELLSNELVSLIYNTEELMFDKLTEGNPVIIGGLTLNKKKTLEIIDLPNGYTELEEAVQAVKAKNTEPVALIRGLLSDQNIGRFFELNEDGDTVSLTEQAEADIEKAGKFYTTDERSIKMLEFVQESIALFISKGLPDYYSEPRRTESIVDVFSKVVGSNINWSTGAFEPNYRQL